ncbi:MAG: hypothetical protein IJW40_07410 [Clostridia bacterium]|nr:hypothetical protein [Clostridia bacterium]
MNVTVTSMEVPFRKHTVISYIIQPNCEYILNKSGKSCQKHSENILFSRLNPLAPASFSGFVHNNHKRDENRVNFLGKRRERNFAKTIAKFPVFVYNGRA